MADRWGISDRRVRQIAESRKTPAGTGSPQLRHGRRSKDLPVRLSKRCEEALTDERLIEMHDEIALVDARLGDVLGRVDKGKSGRWIKEARDAWRRFERAEKAGDEGEVEGARAEVDRLLRGATLDYAAWSEVYTLLEQRRKLAESERKRIEEMHNSVASQQAMAFVGSLE